MVKLSSKLDKQNTIKKAIYAILKRLICLLLGNIRESNDIEVNLRAPLTTDTKIS